MKVVKAKTLLLRKPTNWRHTYAYLDPDDDEISVSGLPMICPENTTFTKLKKLWPDVDFSEVRIVRIVIVVNT